MTFGRSLRPLRQNIGGVPLLRCFFASLPGCSAFPAEPPERTTFRAPSGAGRSPLFFAEACPVPPPAQTRRGTGRPCRSAPCSALSARNISRNIDGGKIFRPPGVAAPSPPGKKPAGQGLRPFRTPILPPSFPFRQISLVFLSPGTSLFDNCAASSARPSFPRTPFVPPDVADPPLPGRAAARFRRPCGLPPSAGLPYRPTLFPNGRISTVRPPIQG